MLSKTRILQAQRNVNNYFQDGLIKNEKNDVALHMYVRCAEESLAVAQKLFSLTSDTFNPSLWVVTTSYYSMYYIANAVLLSLGYKVGSRISHKVTADAMVVFVRAKLTKELLLSYQSVQTDALAFTAHRTDELLKHLDYEREKRSYVQYAMDEHIKLEKAMTSLARAKTFVFELKKLL